VRILSYILKREGYKVLEAMTGTDGLRLVKERNPDLIMLDVFLPDMNGVEIAGKSRTIRTSNMSSLC